MDVENRGESRGTGAEGGETVVGMYCVTEESIFNKRKKMENGLSI